MLRHILVLLIIAGVLVLFFGIRSSRQEDIGIVTSTHTEGAGKENGFVERYGYDISEKIVHDSFLKDLGDKDEIRIEIEM